MSSYLDRADALKSHLEETLAACKAPTPENRRVPVRVDRKLEIRNHMDNLAARAGGGAITILWTGGKNPDRKAKALRMGALYSVFVMVHPEKRRGQFEADDLTEHTMEAMHGWEPDGPGAIHIHRRLEVISVNLLPHRSLVIHEITAEILRL